MHATKREGDATKINAMWDASNRARDVKLGFFMRVEVT